MQSAIGILNAIQKARATKEIIEELHSDSNIQNTIYQQVKRVELNKMGLEAAQMASQELAISKQFLVSALNALEEFEHISKRDLHLAGNIVAAYQHMLGEFILQTRGGLKHENLRTGIAKASFA